jgi:transcriptional regulator with XRE-family HTH domain
MTKETLQKNIGLRIKQLRLQKDISQQDLAAQCNFEKSNMSRLEAGNVNPSAYTLLKIAKSLNIEIKEILPKEERKL